MRPTAVEQSLRILVPSQWTNDEKGDYLERLAANLLARQSYEIVNRVRFTGMEIDLLARHKPSNTDVYVECKFLDRVVGANVLDLMSGQAFRKKIRTLALFSASELSKEAKGAYDDLMQDDRVSFSFYGPSQLVAALLDANLAPTLPLKLPSDVSHATLVVHPDHNYFWLLQQQHDGRPNRLLLVQSSEDDWIDPERIRQLLDDHGVLDGLPVAHFNRESKASEVDRIFISDSQKPELVSQVTTADDLIDYRPCRPEDFVGRTGAQREISKYLTDVREGRSQTRILALTGASGYGKSSLVAKLAELFKSSRWKSKLHLFSVDVRSARGSLFVAEALLAAIRSAQTHRFLPASSDLQVEDLDNVLAGPSINKVLQILEEEEKILVVFFDQFEETLTKDELAPVFRAFHRFALDVQAKQSNLVLGFSWRTGISFSDSNPAYQLWSGLRDHRLTKILDKFNSAESSRVISQFESALESRFIPPLRRRILEQGQGLPWLLKKLCIHVYGQIMRGVSQSKLISGRLNVGSLFDEDLEPLTESQLLGLRYIAGNSPADALEVAERYGQEVSESLIDKRLVIRAGQKLAVYWDIFRDYLNEGKVPYIPLTYVPNSTLSMSLAVCIAIDRTGASSTRTIAEALRYNESTVVNITTDLTNLAVIGRNSVGDHVFLDGMRLNDVAQRLRSQFEEHILFKEILDASIDGVVSKSKAVQLVSDRYSGTSIKLETRNNYLVRLIPWFEYAGLIEQVHDSLRIYSGKQFGPGFGREIVRGQRKGSSEFLGSGTPDSAILLLHKLLEVQFIPSAEVGSAWRNASSDLAALKLVIRLADGIRLTSGLPSNIEELIDTWKAAILRARSMVELEVVVTLHPTASRQELGSLLSQRIGREWKPASALRYASGLMRYRDHILSAEGPQYIQLES